MKYVMKYLLSAVALALVFSACKKDENRITLENGTPPVLTASRTTSVPLSFATQSQEAVKFMWTNPNYSLTTGPSSQNVTYQLEIDTVGSNFKNANRKIISLSGDASVTILQSEFNDYLLSQMRLTAGKTYNIEIRVTSTLVSNAAALYSNILRFAITPYAIPPKVAPPSSGKLFITGSATPGSWQCGCGEAELLTQKFNQVTPTLYVLPSITLSAGNSYLLLPVYGSWSAKYGFTGANNANDPFSFDFKDGGGDIKAPATGGNYKIEVDFQLGKITVTKL